MWFTTTQHNRCSTMRVSQCGCVWVHIQWCDVWDMLHLTTQCSPIDDAIIADVFWSQFPFGLRVQRLRVQRFRSQRLQVWRLCVRCLSVRDCLSLEQARLHFLARGCLNIFDLKTFKIVRECSSTSEQFGYARIFSKRRKRACACSRACMRFDAGWGSRIGSHSSADQSMRLLFLCERLVPRSFCTKTNNIFTLEWPQSV